MSQTKWTKPEFTELELNVELNHEVGLDDTPQRFLPRERGVRRPCHVPPRRDVRTRDLLVPARQPDSFPRSPSGRQWTERTALP